MSVLDLRVSLSASARHYRKLINKRLEKFPDFKLDKLHKFSERPTFAAIDLTRLADLSTPSICCFCGVSATNYQTAEQEFIPPLFSCAGFSSNSSLQLSVPFLFRYARCTQCSNSILVDLTYLAEGYGGSPDWYILNIQASRGQFAQPWIKSLFQKNKHYAVEEYSFWPVSRDGGRWR